MRRGPEPPASSPCLPDGKVGPEQHHIPKSLPLRRAESSEMGSTGAHPGPRPWQLNTQEAREVTEEAILKRVPRIVRWMNFQALDYSTLALAVRWRGAWGLGVIGIIRYMNFVTSMIHVHNFLLFHCVWRRLGEDPLPRAERIRSRSPYWQWLLYAVWAVCCASNADVFRSGDGSKLGS